MDRRSWLQANSCAASKRFELQLDLSDFATDGSDLRSAISARRALSPQFVYEIKISGNVEQVGDFIGNPPW